MTRGTVAGGTFATLLAVLAIAGCERAVEQNVDAAAATSRTTTPSTRAVHEGFLYGRVTTDDGEVHEGRLRFGGDEEALWGNHFNAVKKGNSWAAHVPDGQLKDGRPLKIFGVEIARWGSEVDLGRPFMVRFGDIARIDAPGRELRVTLKSGTVVELARFAADDFADGMQILD